MIIVLLFTTNRKIQTSKNKNTVKNMVFPWF